MKTSPLSAIEQDVFKLANEQYEILLSTIRSPEYQALEHGAVEQFVHQEGTELLRRLFHGHLDLRAANEVQYQSLVGSDQHPRPHHRKDTQRQLETLFGEVVVTRVGYSTKTAYSTPRVVRKPEQIIGANIEKPERPAISNKRVWASVRDDSKEVI
jgi:hypothetical protein